MLFRLLIHFCILSNLLTHGWDHQRHPINCLNYLIPLWHQLFTLLTQLIADSLLEESNSLLVILSWEVKKHVIINYKWKKKNILKLGFTSIQSEYVKLYWQSSYSSSLGSTPLCQSFILSKKQNHSNCF